MLRMKNVSGKWMVRFQQIVAFKNKFGHCNVSRSDPGNHDLALWVKNQRYEYAKGKMNPKKLELLDTIGFLWDVHEAKWFEQLEELKRFKAKHGHCNVPQRVSEVRRLSIWVSTQRLNFKRGKLKRERFLILQNQGFDWSPHETKKKARQEAATFADFSYNEFTPAERALG